MQTDFQAEAYLEILNLSVVSDRVYHDVRSGPGEVVNGVIVEDLILIFLSVFCDNIHEVTGLALNIIGRKRTVNESPLLLPLSVTKPVSLQPIQGSAVTTFVPLKCF